MPTLLKDRRDQQKGKVILEEKKWSIRTKQNLLSLAGQSKQWIQGTLDQLGAWPEEWQSVGLWKWGLPGLFRIPTHLCPSLSFFTGSLSRSSSDVYCSNFREPSGPHTFGIQFSKNKKGTGFKVMALSFTSFPLQVWEGCDLLLHRRDPATPLHRLSTFSSLSSCLWNYCLNSCQSFQESWTNVRYWK